jgi:hypothetical protein
MSASDAYIKTWVMSLSAGVPAWDSTLWVVENRLIPIRSQRVANGSTGQGTFRVLRKSRLDDNLGLVTSTWTPTRGQYIAITTQACTLPGAAGTLWTGYIEDFDRAPLRNSADDTGILTARQLGGVLDQVPLANPRVIDVSGALPGGFSLLSIPTANAEGLTQGEVMGNAIAAPAAAQPGSGGSTRMQWAANAATYGTYWSRWALLDHFAKWIYSPILPAIVLSAPAAVQTLLDTSAKEVFKLQGLTFKGMLDLLCGASRGLRWYISYSGNTWTVNILSALDAAVGSIPAATLTPITLANDASIRLTQSGFDVYDAAEVNGNTIVFGGTISPIDGTADKGWSAASETAYKVGASLDPSYAGLITDEERVIANQTVRKTGLLADVFARYVVAQDATFEFQCKNTAGVPSAGAVQFFCPLVTWSGAVAAIDDTQDMAPYPPEARILRQLPWVEGKRGDGTDLRAPEAQARPKYLAPVALAYQIPGEANWTNLARPPLAQFSAPDIHPDTRGPALRVAFEYQEMLAYADWAGAAPGEYRFDPTNTDNRGASDWRKLVLTVAMASDQRVKVATYRSGVTSTTYRNPLRINRPDLHCLVMRKHSIIGLKADGTPDEVATDTFVRNDFAVAQKLADEIAAFAFRPRQGAAITITAPHNPPAWADESAAISTMTEPDGSVSYTLNTPVAEITQIWDARAPRLVVVTGDPSMPDSTALVPLTPAFGGSVSTALGMTLPAMAQRMDTELKDLQRAQERVPIIAGRLPSVTQQPDYRSESVHQLAHGFVVGDAVGTVTSIPFWYKVSTSLTADARGIVVSVAGVDDFTVAITGVIPWAGTAGLIYSLSGTAGTLTTTYTSQSIGVLFAISATEAVLLPPTASAISTIADPTHGNARGTNAVDLQQSRSANTMVASGAGATISGGTSNTASGNGSTVVGGSGNVASGGSSVAGGVNCTASGDDSVALGSNSQANALQSVALQGGVADAPHSFAAIDGWARANYAASIGLTSVALGAYSWALGYGAAATAAGSFVLCTDYPFDVKFGTALGGADHSVGLGRGFSITHANAMVLAMNTGGTTGSNGANTLTLGFASGVYLSGDVYRNGTRILTTQQGAITAPTGGATVDTPARTAINAILAALTAHGLTA